MQKLVKRTVAAAAMLLAVSGCANLNSISRSSGFPTSNGRVLTVDAKQRHFFVNQDLNPETDVYWRVCAEAAPDVFSALASSGGLTVDLSSQPSGSGSFSMAETAATIQRTQSVNLIRESFYRTCERYASGAISRTQFIVQAARDQRAMVSILAIEQLTGAFRPPATIISGPGTQASAFSGREAAELVRDSRERRDLAEAARDAAKSAVTEAEKDNGVCGEGEQKDETKCAELRLALTNAEGQLETAQRGLDNTLEIARNLSESANAQTSTGTNSTGGLTQSVMSTSNARVIADAVVEIHRAAVINEPLMFCMTVLTEDRDLGIFTADEGSKGEIVTRCLDILAQAAFADSTFLSRSVSFSSGEYENILSRYIDLSLSQDEQDRRNRVLLGAMRAAGLGETTADLFEIVAAGTENQRRRLVEAAKAIEDDETALEALK